MSKEHRFIFWGVLLIVVLLSVSSITFPIFVAQTIKNQNIICIDAGHGGSDPGKVGNPNILEKDINLSISLKLQKLLEKKNFKVYMTRNGDYNLSDSKGNQKRSDVHGAQVFYPQGSEKSKQLADSIQSALIKGLDPTNHREAKANDQYYLFQDNPYPIVIVECGFLSNPEELKALQNNKYQQKAVKCIVDGIITYINNK